MLLTVTKFLWRYSSARFRELVSEVCTPLNEMPTKRQRNLVIGFPLVAISTSLISSPVIGTLMKCDESPRSRILIIWRCTRPSCVIVEKQLRPERIGNLLDKLDISICYPLLSPLCPLHWIQSSILKGDFLWCRRRRKWRSSPSNSLP